MIKFLTKLFSAVIFISVAMPAPVRAEGLPQSDALVIHADSLTYEKASDTYRAFGNVHLEWDEMKLVADRALLRQSENTAEAEGKVVVTKGGDILHGDKMNLDLESQQGEVTNGYLFVTKGNYHLRGTKMKKVGEEDYHIDKGYLTTCDGDAPSWKFSASSLDLHHGEYATGRNVLFYIRDVPVLYFPYIVFPVKRERQSGFLIPQFGTSSLGGIYLTIPYYWAISPSQDATFTLDIQSKRGVGTGVDYRYLGKGGSTGSFRGYLIYDTSKDKLRGDLNQKHQGEFSPTLFFRSDINYVSDNDFFRDYAQGFGKYNQKSTDTYVFLTKHWQRFLLTPELRYTQDLESASNVTTLQKLPILTFTGTRQKIWKTPLYFSLDSNFTNFYREEGLQGQRTDLHPTLLFYTGPIAGLEGSVWAGYEHRFYNTYEGTGGNGLNDTGLYDAGITVSSSLAKVYDTGWKKLVKLQHTVIPEVSYTYVQHKNQDSLPFFDFNDRVVHENTMTYSVANYLTGKFVDGDAPAAYRQLAYLRLSQRYDLSGSRRDLLTPYDELHPFTDIRIEAKINPLRQVSLETDSRFNPYHTDFSTTNLILNYTDDQGDLVGASYRFARTQYSYFEGRVGIALVKPFIFNFTGRYSFDRGDFLESLFSLEYRHQCWSTTFTYWDRPGNKSFFVNIALAGIGSLARIRGF